MRNFDILGDLKVFINKRSGLIIKRQFQNLDILQRAHYLIKTHYEFAVPSVYHTRSGCEVEDFGWYAEQGAYSAHDSVRVLGSLITHNFNECSLNLCIGNYYSSIILLRSVFEWELKILAAITDVSVLTGDNNHKSRITCLDGLRHLEQANKLNRQNKTQVKILKKKLNKINTLNLPLHSKQFGVYFLSTIQSYTQIIKGLDPRLIKYLDKRGLKNHAETLLDFYTNFSEYTHISIEKLDSLRPGGEKEFYNRTEFDRFFKIIIDFYDLILYLYLIIHDLEVNHMYDPKKRHERRAQLKRA